MQGANLVPVRTLKDGFAAADGHNGCALANANVNYKTESVMRKIYVTLLVAFVAMMCMPVSAQIKFGVKAGLDVTNLKFNHDLYDKDNRTGFYIGPTMKFSLIGLGFDASLLYDQRSANLTSEWIGDGITNFEDQGMTQKQIVIPVNLRYTVGLGSFANVFLFAGPQVGFNVGGDKELADGWDWKWKNSNFSVNVGFGFTVLNHLQLNANYNVACGKTGEASINAVSSGFTHARARYNAWQVGLAYYF